MELIEVLIVLAFIVLPLLEGVLKRRRSGQGEPPPIPRPAPEAERERVGAASTADAPRSAGPGPDAGPAADMIPSDLWEVLTGERRPRPAPAEAPWEMEDEAASQEAALEEVGAEGDPGDSWDAPPWSPEPDPSWSRWEEQVPESLEYVGPEAISLEAPPAPPEVRHRRFHEKYDDAPPIELPEGGLIHELRQGLQGAGLRRSVLLAEILGPPKGLT